MPQAAYPEVTLGHRAAGFPATSLFGLAPGGVCRAVRVATCAVRSYRTISPLPAPPLRVARRRYLSVALSVGSRLPGVTWHPALWSPDFPPFRLAAKTRLPGRLSCLLSPTGKRIDSVSVF